MPENSFDHYLPQHQGKSLSQNLSYKLKKANKSFENDQNSNDISYSDINSKRKMMSPFAFIKPPAILTQVIKRNTKFRLQTQNLSLRQKYKTSTQLNAKSRGNASFGQNILGNDQPDLSNLQMSFLNRNTIEPYIKLKDINELYDTLSEKNIKETPFLKEMLNKDFNFPEFIDFVWDTWKKETHEIATFARRTSIRNRIFSVISKASSSRKKAGDSNDTSPISIKSRKNKLNSFGDYMTMYKEKTFLEQNKKEINVNEVKEKGMYGILEELQYPSISEANVISKTREACRKFYLQKLKLREQMLKKLDSVASERPFMANYKQKSLIQNGIQNISSYEEEEKNDSHNNKRSNTRNVNVNKKNYSEQLSNFLIFKMLIYRCI